MEMRIEMIRTKNENENGSENRAENEDKKQKTIT